MRYAVARFNQNLRDTAYRIYVTDCLRIIAQNTGSYPQERFIDELIQNPDDDMEPEEVIQAVIDKIGLEVSE